MSNASLDFLREPLTEEQRADVRKATRKLLHAFHELWFEDEEEALVDHYELMILQTAISYPQESPA